MNKTPKKDTLTGSMSRFGAYNLKFKVGIDKNFIFELGRKGARKNLPVGTLGESNDLDHGIMIPLYFLEKEMKDVKIVKIGVSGLPLIDHFLLGSAIEETSKDMGNRVVIIASGDLSHKCKEDGPYGFSQAGVDFDEKLIDVLSRGNYDEVLKMTESEIEEAAECGLRPVSIMLGALNAKKVKAELFSYENTFGVGYAIMSFTPQEEDKDRDYINKYFEKQKRQIAEARKGESIYVYLARNAIEYFVANNQRLEILDELPRELLEEKAACFVTLKIDGGLRGCIGTITPRHQTLAEEIITNAISACSEDPRFNRVESGELSSIVYSVDVLSPIEDIQSKSELDPKKYGVIVRAGRKQGLLLPMLEGVDTVDRQIEIALNKAGIPQNSNYSLSRFKVTRHY